MLTGGWIGGSEDWNSRVCWRYGVFQDKYIDYRGNDVSMDMDIDIDMDMDMMKLLIWIEC